MWYCIRTDILISGIELRIHKPHIHGQMRFDKFAKIIQWEKESLLNEWCWDHRYLHAKTNWIPSSHINKNELIKWVTDPHLRAKIMKLLEKNTEVTLCDLESGTAFLGMITKTQVTKITKNWSYTKLKTLMLQRILSRK